MAFGTIKKCFPFLLLNHTDIYLKLLFSYPLYMVTVTTTVSDPVITLKFTVAKLSNTRKYLSLLFLH